VSSFNNNYTIKKGVKNGSVANFIYVINQMEEKKQNPMLKLNLIGYRKSVY